MGRLSITDRVKIVDRVEHGWETMRAVAKQFKVSTASVSKLMKKYRAVGDVANIQRKPRPKKLSPKDLKRVKRAVAARPKRTLKKTKAALNLDVCTETLRKTVRSMGYSSRRPRRVPLTSKKNISARFNWASGNLLRPASYWQRLCVTDESRFSCVGNDSLTRVWRKKDEAFKPACTVRRKQAGGGSVLVWGGLSVDGPGPLVWIKGTVDSEFYCDLLRNTIDPWLKSLPFKPVMLQDGAPAHTSRVTRETLAGLDIQLMDWVTQSPDANCIENAWSIIKRRLSAK